MVKLIKNGLQLITTNTAGVGKLANFLMGSALVCTAGIIYGRKQAQKTALIGYITGSVAVAAAAGILNYFVLLPLFKDFMPLEHLIASFTAFIPFIK